jgi:hypothetical protein
VRCHFELLSKGAIEASITGNRCLDSKDVLIGSSPCVQCRGAGKMDGRNIAARTHQHARCLRRIRLAAGSRTFFD